MTKFLKETATSKKVANIKNEDAVLRLIVDGIKPHDAVRNTIAHCFKHGNYAALKEVAAYLNKSTGKAQWIQQARMLVSLVQTNEPAVKVATAVCRKNHISLALVVVLVEKMLKLTQGQMQTALASADEVLKCLPAEAPEPKVVKPAKPKTRLVFGLDATDEEIALAVAQFRGQKAPQQALAG